jgi:hypothetical protein
MFALSSLDLRERTAFRKLGTWLRPPSPLNCRIFLPSLSKAQPPPPLTFEHAGRDYRLTDIYGEAATKILA